MAIMRMNKDSGCVRDFLLTHADADAFGCMVVFFEYLKLFRSYDMFKHFDIFADQKTGEGTTDKMLDFASSSIDSFYKPKTMFIADRPFIRLDKARELLNSGYTIYFADHHVNSIELIPELNKLKEEYPLHFFFKVSDEHSGALLLHKLLDEEYPGYYIKGESIQLLHYISLWDTFQWKNHPNEIMVEKALQIKACDAIAGIAAMWRHYLCLGSEGVLKLAHTCYEIQKIKDEAAWNNKWAINRTQFNKGGKTYRLGYVSDINIPYSEFSMFCERYFKEIGDLDIILLISITSVSVRVSPNSDLDGAEFCKNAGLGLAGIPGGGHKKAAGYKNGIDIKEFMQEIISLTVESNRN